MTVTIQSTDNIGTGFRFAFAAGSDSYIILPGATVASPTSSTVFFGILSNLSLDVGGALVSASMLQQGGNDVSISVGAGGRIVSLELVSGNAALFLNSDGSRFDNAGELISDRCIGVLSDGGNDVVNSGRIVAASRMWLGLGGGGDTLTNSGSITANRTGDASNDTRFNNGVFAEGQNTRITNLAGGVITGSSSEGAGVRVGEAGGGTTVVNDGVIQALIWYGVDFSDLTAFEFARLTNTGTIRGLLGSFNGNDTTDIVANRGTMSGNVLLNDGDDSFDGRGGQVIGDILGGIGNDVIDVRGASLVGTLSGEDGQDTIRGGDFDDSLYGGTGDDLLSGGGGYDDLTGGDGNDTLQGNDGDDNLLGLEGLLVAFGGAGDDVLSVNVNLTSAFTAGHGGAGNDTFLGGQSRDDLFGGDGDDVFLADAGTDSVQGGLGNDQMTLFDGDDSGAGGQGDDTLLGLSGLDLLEGGEGDDLLDGGADADTLSGAAGRDTLVGGAGFDQLDGGDDDDLLFGGGFGDQLRGDRGNDLVTGGGGKDTLNGGLGNDSFVFTLVSDSGLGAAADVIEDFARGKDLVDISALAATPFVFRGTSAFSGSGTASVRLDVTGASVTVQIDANGDAVADSAIVLTGLSALAATDFLL